LVRKHGKGGASRLALVVLLATGTVAGYSDGDEFDAEGCGVAQQTEVAAHGDHSAQSRQDDGSKLPPPGGVAAGCGPDPKNKVVLTIPECEARAASCEHRMGNGDCRRLGRRCRLAEAWSGVLKGDFVTILKWIQGKLGSVCDEVVELRSANARLKKMLADGLFAFTQKVDPTSFKVLCAILAEGDVAKASRTLKMPDGTIRTLMRRWRTRGREYQAMLELVRWRKAIGRIETVALNENVLLEKADSADYPGLIADVLEKVTEMTGQNWRKKAQELEEMLRAVV
jgi:hypothetical protein